MSVLREIFSLHEQNNRIMLCLRAFYILNIRHSEDIFHSSFLEMILVPDQHEHFEKILKICRDYVLVLNFTTSGYGMTPEIVQMSI